MNCLIIIKFVLFQYFYYAINSINLIQFKHTIHNLTLLCIYFQPVRLTGDPLEVRHWSHWGMNMDNTLSLGKLLYLCKWIKYLPVGFKNFRSRKIDIKRRKYLPYFSHLGNKYSVKEQHFFSCSSCQLRFIYSQIFFQLHVNLYLCTCIKHKFDCISTF